MSLSVDPEIQDRLKRVARRRDVSVSKLVRDMVDKFLNDDDNVDMVILKVPKTLKEDHDGLRSWLHSRFESVAAALNQKS
jgi:predicted DNA-binding ribbon-helix-helix protein